jgi:nitrogen fixation-related uncharacterized protein
MKVKIFLRDAAISICIVVVMLLSFIWSVLEPIR